MGTTNVFYQYENNGELKNADWVENALKFINEYANGNVLDAAPDESISDAAIKARAARGAQ